MNLNPTQQIQIQCDNADALQLQPVEVAVPGSIIPEAMGLLVQAKGARGLATPLITQGLRRLAIDLLVLAEQCDAKNAENAAKVAAVNTPNVALVKS